MRVVAAPRDVGQGEAAVAASSSEQEMPVRAVASGPLRPRRAAEAAPSPALHPLLVPLGGATSLRQAIRPSMPAAQGARDTPMTTARGKERMDTVVRAIYSN